jgi:hypothetical protein
LTGSNEATEARQRRLLPAQFHGPVEMPLVL